MLAWVVQKLGEPKLRMVLSSLITAALISANPAAAAGGELPHPKVWLQKVVDRASALAKTKVQPDTKEEEKWQTEAKALIDDMIDWNRMTEDSLGTQWKERSPKEQQEFS